MESKTSVVRTQDGQRAMEEASVEGADALDPTRKPDSSNPQSPTYASQPSHLPDPSHPPDPPRSSPRRRGPARLPYALALTHRTIVSRDTPSVCEVAVESPLSSSAVEQIEQALHRPIKQVRVPPAEWESLWERQYRREATEESVYGLYHRTPMESAIVTLSRIQRIVGLAALVLLGISLILDAMRTLQVLNIAIQVLYAVLVFIRTGILVRGYPRKNLIRFTPKQIAALDDDDLPVYTLLVPLYHEANIAERLVHNLDAIDYPRDRLDIRLLLEQDDVQTRDALAATQLDACYTIVEVPPAAPRTKPKACNYGLLHARGAYVVIYDAEDQPEPDQLKKAVLAFRELPESVVCLQCGLNYYNSGHNLLTQWFTQEYSTWFDILLLGVHVAKTPIPLGGTSNHFRADKLRELGAWDPFNVTEDADLGVRLHGHGYRTAMLDSHTWEEANANIRNWVRQRSRWIKGYMQTWLVYMRRPAHLARTLGAAGSVGFHAMLLGTPLIPMLNPIFWAMLIAWYVFEPSFIQRLMPGALYYIAASLFLMGNFLFVYTNAVGAYAVVREGELRGRMRIGYSVVLSGVLLPVYWVLMSVAAYRALVQLFTKPFYWEKTQHGLTEQVDEPVVEVEGELEAG